MRPRRGQLLAEGRLTDTFRAVHPDARHCYSYWSQRAGNRPWNRGLRLDYWLLQQYPSVDDLAAVSKGLAAAPIGTPRKVSDMPWPPPELAKP